MFGYVYVNKPELKIREFEKYRANYCGLCRKLYTGHGTAARLTLNYDMTFLKILLENLYDPQMRSEMRRCILHPLKPHEEITSDISDYCADMNVLLAAYNALDDWKDERSAVKYVLYLFLRKKAGRISNVYKKKAERIKEALEELYETEKRGETDIEVPACIFGKIMGEIFTYQEADIYSENLRACGFYLGKFIYILDAYDDVEDDIKKGSYNPFKDIKDSAGYDEHVKELLTMAVSKSAYFFEKLPVTGDTEILRNILYAGCWCRYESIREKRKDGSI